MDKLCEKFNIRLRECSNEIIASNSAKILKCPSMKLLGVPSKSIRLVIKEFMPSIKELAPDELILFISRLVSSDIFEEQQSGIEILYNFRNSFDAGYLLKKVEGWIKDGTFRNWAAIDTISNHLVAYLIDMDNDLQLDTIRWASDDNFWLRRASAVAYILPARQGRYLDSLYKIAELLYNDAEDYVNKGVGWALRDAGLADKTRLVEFINKHGREMPRTALRYAIEKFPKDERLDLLNKTKLK